MTIDPRQEELLSYLQGRAPVGQTFVVTHRDVVNDLNLPHGNSVCRGLNALARSGLIDRVYGKEFPRQGAIVVLKPLERM